MHHRRRRARNRTVRERRGSMAGMASPLVAGPPLESPRHRVGRSTAMLVDASRGDRVVTVDTWYPAAPGASGRPVALRAAAGHRFHRGRRARRGGRGRPRTRSLLWSHGRTATRSAYALLCEAIAARGFIVIAPDHVGDSLADWLLGANVDDETNDANRVGDVRFVLDTVFDDARPAPRGRCPGRSGPRGRGRSLLRRVHRADPRGRRRSRPASARGRRARVADAHHPEGGPGTRARAHAARGRRARTRPHRPTPMRSARGPCSARDRPGASTSNAPAIRVAATSGLYLELAPASRGSPTSCTTT